jgi:peptide/nickel transport system permease protein
VALLSVAILGPWIAPYPPDATDILAANQSPSPAHVLGTDSLGRDIFSRLLWGARISYAAAALIVVFSMLSGCALAVLSAWFGGAVDAGVGGTLNVMIAVPGILVALIAVTILGTGFWAPVIAMSIASAPYVARIIRSSALVERRKPYIEALTLSGVSSARINMHIVRGLSSLILAQATFSFGVALLEFGALSFIGLGIQAPTAEWGAMVVAGRSELLSGNMQQTFAAGAMIVISVVAFTLLGDRLARVVGRAA